MLSKLSAVINDYEFDDIMKITFCKFYVVDLTEYEMLKVSKEEVDVAKLKEINSYLGKLRFSDDTAGFVDWRNEKRIYVSSPSRSVEKNIIKALKGKE